MSPLLHFSSLHINKSPLSNYNRFLTCGLLSTLCNFIHYLYNKIRLFRSLLALMKRNRFVCHMEKGKAYFLNNVILLLSHFSLFSICESCQRQHSTSDNTYIDDYLFHRLLQFLDSTDIKVEHNTFKENYKEKDAG